MEDGDDGAAAHGHKHGGAEGPPGGRAEGGDGGNCGTAETKDGDLGALSTLWEVGQSGGGYHGPVCQCQFPMTPKPVVDTGNETPHNQHHDA